MEDLKRRMERRCQENLEFLHQNFPELVAKIGERGRVAVEIEFLTPSQYTLLVDGRAFYPVHPEFHARKLVEEFARKPRTLLTPFHTEIPPMETLFHTYLQKAVALGEKYGLAPGLPLRWDGKRIHLLVVSGLLFGHHLEALLERFEVRYLVLLEQDPNLLKVSLYTLDWRKLLEYFRRKDRRFSLIVDHRPQVLAQEFLNTVNNEAGVLFLLFFYYFRLYDHTTWKAFEDLVAYRLQSYIRGWGFYDDEIVSLVHTLQNLENDVPVLAEFGRGELSGAACVVGSGPSLDEQLDWLRRHRDHLTVFSCGTAVKTLEAADLKPDFQVEIERTTSTYLALKEVSPEFLRDIPLLGPSALYAPVFRLSRRPAMFLKNNDLGGFLLKEHCGGEVLTFCTPTVTNTGLALALKMGFRRIYLAGVDLGFPDETRHHSRHTVYYREGPFRNLLNQETRPFQRPDGRTVYTTDLLLWAKKEMEALVNNYRKVGINPEIYNLSDTVPLEGVPHLPPSKAAPGGRREIPSLEGLLRPAGIEDLSAVVLKLEEKASFYNRRLLKGLKKRYLHPEDIYGSILADIWPVIKDWYFRHPTSWILYRGTNLHMLRMLLTTSFVIEREHLRAFTGEFRSFLREFYEKSRKNLENLRMIIREGRLSELEPNAYGIRRDLPAFYVFIPR